MRVRPHAPLPGLSRTRTPPLTHTRTARCFFNSPQSLRSPERLRPSILGAAFACGDAVGGGGGAAGGHANQRAGAVQ
eukprot:1338976-Pleurochrysis_carterae.AAC.1